MGLRLILGRAGSGKTARCLEEITAELERAPRGTPLIFLVPEQATFHAEYQLASRRGLGGTIRAQVLSFRRLAWRVLQEQGSRHRFFLNDTGKSMLLRRVIENRREELRIFDGAGEQAGGIENLVQLYNEFKRSGLSALELDRILGEKFGQDEGPPSSLSASPPAATTPAAPSTSHGPAAPADASPAFPASSTFLHKLQDLRLLFLALEQEVGDRYLDAEDALTLLQLGIPGSAFLQEARVWVDGFYGFTNQEYGVLEALLRRCPEVTVTLCLEQEVGPREVIPELHPFHPAALACQQLQQRAARAGIPREIQRLNPRPEERRFAANPALAHLERHLHTYPAVPCALAEEETGIRLVSAANRRCEVEATARALIALARDQGYRWRDMALLTGDPEAYDDLVRTLFQDYEIPYFLDRERPVLHHPLVEFLRSALEVLVHNWRSDAVFRCIKTDFLFPLPRSPEDTRRWRERADRLENYVLAFGIQGRSRWEEQDPWLYLERETLEDLDEPEDREELADQKEPADLEDRNHREELRAGEETRGGEFPPSGREDPEELPSMGRVTAAREQEAGYQVGSEPPARGASTPPFTGEQRRFLEEINETRKTLAAPLLAFQRQMGAATTVQDKARALFALLERCRATRRLEGMIQACARENRPEQVRQHRQVYEEIVDLLEQLVETMGEETVSTALFARLLETGLENLRLSLVPPSLDQVLVGNVERTRVSQVRWIFLLGVNDGCLPSRPPEDSVFTEEERERLLAWGLELAPGSRRRLLDQQFLVYMALTRASRGLWLSYALANEEGQGLVPSLLLDRLTELFPHLTIKTVEPEPPATPARSSGTYPVDHLDHRLPSEQDPDPDQDREGSTAGSTGYVPEDHPLDQEDQEGEGERIVPPEAWTPLSYVAHPRRALAHAAVRLGEARKGAALEPLWQDVYNWFTREKTPWQDTAARCLRALTYQNREKPLARGTALALYGQPLRAGVGRLEKHRACPFAHFAAYGLRLQERRVYRLEAPDIGRLFHVVLRNIALELRDRGQDWSHLDFQASRELARQQVEQLAPRLQKEILLSSSRYRYLARKLTDTVGRAAGYLGEQARRGRFRTVGVEVEFGRGKSLPEPPLDLGEGASLELVGRVDRIDLARDEEAKEAFVRVIDYKSAATRLPLLEIYHGLSLQMLVYLEVVLRHLPAWLGLDARPAAVLYYPLRVPLLSCSAPPPEETLQDQLLRQYKMQGRVLADPRVVRLMDRHLESGHSLIVPAGIKQSGEFYENAAVLAEADFRRLGAHAHRQVRETARAVYAGEVDIRPFRLGKETACRYCPYRPVCQFDPGLESNRYRLVPYLGEQEILQRLRSGNKEEKDARKS